jgi:hypothetical protein
MIKDVDAINLYISTQRLNNYSKGWFSSQLPNHVKEQMALIAVRRTV